MSSINQVPGQSAGALLPSNEQGLPNQVNHGKVDDASGAPVGSSVSSENEAKKIAEQSVAQGISASQVAKIASMTGSAKLPGSSLPDLPMPNVSPEARKNALANVERIQDSGGGLALLCL